MTPYGYRRRVTMLVVLAFVPVVGMDVTHGTASEIWMGLAALAWIAVIVTATATQEGS